MAATVVRRPTGRQLEVIRLLAEGHRYADIGAILGYAEDTISERCKQARARVGAATNCALVAYAYRAGWFPIDDNLRFAERLEAVADEVEELRKLIRA